MCTLILLKDTVLSNYCPWCINNLCFGQTSIIRAKIKSVPSRSVNYAINTTNSFTMDHGSITSHLARAQALAYSSTILVKIDSSFSNP